jgi:hypothetical protein
MFVMTMRLCTLTLFSGYMSSIPIVRKTGNEMMDLFQRTIIDFLKEALVIFSRGKQGLVPPAPSGNGTTKFLREDGTWAVP